jgi:hypothetical protein
MVQSPLMDTVRCEVVRWVIYDLQEGQVEARLTDADGVQWSFFDKPQIFTADPVLSTTSLPIPGVIRCEILGIRHDDEGREVIDVELKDGVESVDGRSRFRVRREQLRN